MKNTVATFKKAKEDGKKLSMLTAMTIRQRVFWMLPELTVFLSEIL